MDDLTSILDRLDNKQALAARSRGCLLLGARAGTGKTAVGACRIAVALVEQQLYPHEALALTFTNKAALEFRDRLAATLPATGHQVRVNTFHRLALSLVEMHRGCRVKILGPELRQDLLRDMVRTYLKQHSAVSFSPSQNTGAARYAEGERLFSNPYRLAERAGQEITALKGRGVYPEPGSNPGNHYQGVSPEMLTLLEEVYPAYQAHLLSNNLLDLDDLVPTAARCLREMPELVRIPGVGVKLVVVDESQDVEPSRLELLLALMHASREQLKIEPQLLAVGDELQRIYCFDGEGSFSWLARSLPGLVRTDLARQYRYGPTINEAANRVATALGHSQSVTSARSQDDPDGKFGQVLDSQTVTSIGSGSGKQASDVGKLPIGLYPAEDEQEEAFFLAGEIQKLRVQAPAASIGVLVSQRRQLTAIAAAARRLQIEFELKSKEPDLEQEVKEIEVQVRARPVEPSPEPKVSLMTIHAAKGLAFDVVMLPGLSLNLWPRTPSDARRDLMLFMVGLTRTRYLAYLSYPRVITGGSGKPEKAGPSPFLSLLTGTDH